MKDYNELFKDYLDYTEFRLEKYEDGFGIVDLQGVNLGNIESDRFSSALEIVDRMDIYVKDCFLEDEVRGTYDSLDDMFESLSPDDYLYPIVDMLVNHIDEVDLKKVYEKY